MSVSDIGVTSQSAGTKDLKETGREECLPSDDATADELFDSFMEIANDPSLQSCEHADGTLDQSDTPIAEPTLHDLQIGTCDQNESVDLQRNVQVKEAEKLDQREAGLCEPGSQVEDTGNNGAAENPISPVNKGLVQSDSPEAIPSTSDVESVQSDIGQPTGNTEHEMSNSVTDESKLEELCGKAGQSETLDPAFSNEDEQTEQQNCEIGLLEVSTGDKGETATTEGKEIQESAHSKDQLAGSPPSDCKESFTEQSVAPNDGDAGASKTEVSQRLSKAVEDLAGLEQLLSTAVSELKVANCEKKIDETVEGEDVRANAMESELLEDEKIELDHGSSVTEVEERVDVDGNGVKGEHLEVLADGSDTLVCKTGEEQAVCEASADEVTDLQVSGTASGNDLLLNSELSSNDTEKVIRDESEKADEDDVESPSVTLEGAKQYTSELQHAKTDTSVGSLEKVKQDAPSSKDCQVEGLEGVGAPSAVQVDFQGGTPSAIQGSGNQEDLKSQTCVEELPRKTSPEELKNNSEASDKDNEVENEVANASKAVPGIEITMTDESGISENKSLDSLDTEESSNSRPASPAASDEGIDSDAPSDYGEDDEDATFDPENTNSSAVCHGKSWLLELDRDRLSSDSSTVSEKDFKESYTKGDTADGKSSDKDYIRGHLLKMGGTGLTPKNWRKRWFVLRSDNCLYYYKSSKDKGPCGVIILSNYSVSKAPEVNKNHCFKLTKGGARTYYMCAASDADMKKWMVSMMDAVKESAKESNPFNILEGNVHNVSIPALSIRDPDCHGYLYKQGNNYKIWRRRYFVLKNGFLYYYTDMSNTVALGVAKLLDYRVTAGEHSGKKFYFSAASSGQSFRTYHFAAESEMDRKRWLLRLEDSIRKGSSTH